MALSTGQDIAEPPCTEEWPGAQDLLQLRHRLRLKRTDPKLEVTGVVPVVVRGESALLRYARSLDGGNPVHFGF